MADIIYRNLRNLYHTTKWILHFIGDYFYYRKYFGSEYSRLIAGAEITARYKFKDAEFYISNKNEYIKHYLKRALNNIVAVYRETSPVIDEQSNSKRIWILWWDGMENAPEIVKACVRSAYRAAGDKPVVLLDKDNYTDYVTLPEEIRRKHDAGIIGHAHFSDMIRLSLLAKYGGLWVDATVYFTEPIPEDVFSKHFFTCKQNEMNPLTPSHGLWAGWILSGNQDCPLFAFGRDALIYYWQTHDHIIDYLLMDYVFDIAYECIPEVHHLVDSLEANNPDRHELMNRINAPFDPVFFDRNTWFYKLSYRYGNPKLTTADGHKTFYNHILNEGSRYET